MTFQGATCHGVMGLWWGDIPGSNMLGGTWVMMSGMMNGNYEPRRQHARDNIPRGQHARGNRPRG